MSKSEGQTEADPVTSKRSLPRREWLTAFAVGGVATATAALGYDSCQAPPRAADSPELELDYIKAALKSLRAMNYVEEGQRQGILDTNIDQALATNINQFLGTSYQTLVYSELVNALPEDIRKSDEVQNDIADMSPVLDQAVADSYFVIGMADDDLKSEIDRELREDPDLLMDMAAGLDEEGGRHGMGIHGRLRLRRASSQLSARLRMQSTNEVVTDVTDKITRIAERNGVKEGDGRHFEVSSAARGMVSLHDDPITSVPSPPPPVVEPSTGYVPPPPPDEERSREIARLERKAKRLTRVSIGLAGTGAGLLIIGGVVYGATAAVGPLVPITFGALAILLALFILGAAVRRRRELEEAKSHSTTGQ